MKIKPIAYVLAACAALVVASPAPAVFLDLTTAGASGYIGSAFFQQVNNTPTGTGVIDPFLRMQANSPPAERGVNSNGPYVYDEKSGIWTHAIHLSDFGVVTNPDNGVASIRVLLDVNETASGNLLSWDDLRFYTATVGTYNNTTDLDNNGTLVYDMDGGGDSWVGLNYNLDNGSGSGDVLTYIPVALFAGHESEWLYLYSEFGGQSGWESDDGFEEFARVDNPTAPPPVPEPASLLLLGGGLLGLAGFGAARGRRR